MHRSRVRRHHGVRSVHRGDGKVECCAGGGGCRTTDGKVGDGKLGTAAIPANGTATTGGEKTRPAK